MIDQKYLVECFSYNDQTGDVFWKQRPPHHFKSEHAMKCSNRRTKDKKVGMLHSNGHGKNYFTVSFSTIEGKKQFLLHRVIWMLVYGEWPECTDHVNGDGLDNRLCNLRSVTIEENNRNMRLMKHNTSGHAGVHKNRYGTWTCYIWNQSKQINIGTYETKKEAIAARKGAERALGYRFSHGEKRSK